MNSMMKLIHALMLAIGLALGFAVPAAADGCDDGCFMLGPGSAEYGQCVVRCHGMATTTPGRLPTISDPLGVRPVIMHDEWVLICNDLRLNGVSVASVQNIFHHLENDQEYQYTPHDAGWTVGMAVENTCPQYKSALANASRAATR
jgi:hypothetical protein